MKYLLAILVISIIIIVHEFGHFIVAKASGVKVVEFSLGMGPRLIKFTKKDTMYSIKLFLFGGSCQMLGGMDDDATEGSFNCVSVWKRMAIIIAGPLFNFILAFIGAVFIIGKVGYDPAVIYSVEENSPAYEAGLEAGDKIVKVNGKKVVFYGDYSMYMYFNEGSEINVTYIRDGKKYRTYIRPEHITEPVYQMGVYMDREKPEIIGLSEDGAAKTAGILEGDVILSINGQKISSTDEVSPIVKDNKDNELTVVISRDGSEKEIKLVPQKVEQNYYNYGFYLSGERVKCSPAGTIKYAFKQMNYQIRYSFTCLKMIFRGKVKLDDMAGPVGVVNVIGDVVEESREDGALYVVLNVLNLMILISANLGFMNLLPIPALDGGRLVFLIIEAVTGKPVPKEKEGIVHLIGAILLLILTVVVLFNDISKFFR